MCLYSVMHGTWTHVKGVHQIKLGIYSVQPVRVWWHTCYAYASQRRKCSTLTDDSDDATNSDNGDSDDEEVSGCYPPQLIQYM